MERQSSSHGGVSPTAPPARHYGLPMTETIGVRHADCEGITEEQIRAVVVEFYRRARLDDVLGPVFEAYVEEWDRHLARMTDFWSAALLRSGRYSGRPIERHRGIAELRIEHFDRWIELFEDTVRDICADHEAEAFLVRARKMRDAMSKLLELDN